MPRVQENAPGIRPSRSISRGSRISTITTSSLCAALMESTALTVSICALASSIRDLMPRWMVWGIDVDLDLDWTGRELRQVIRDREPRRLAGDVDVKFGTDTGIVIQRTERHAVIRDAVKPGDHGRTARPAKT